MVKHVRLITSVVFFVSCLTGAASAMNEALQYPQIDVLPSAPPLEKTEMEEIQLTLERSLNDCQGPKSATKEKSAGQSGAQRESKEAIAADCVAIPWREIPLWCYLYFPRITEATSNHRKDNGSSVNITSINVGGYRLHDACILGSKISVASGFRNLLSRSKSYIHGAFMVTTAAYVASTFVPLISPYLSGLVRPCFVGAAAAEAVFQFDRFAHTINKASQNVHTISFKSPVSCKKLSARSESWVNRILNSAFSWRSAQVAYQA